MADGSRIAISLPTAIPDDINFLIEEIKLNDEIIELTSEEIMEITGSADEPVLSRSEQYPEIENIPP